MVNIDSFQAYIRDTSDTEIARLCLDAAKQKAASADVKEPEDDNAHYELFIYALAAYWYDNRGLVDIGGDSQAVQNMINTFVLELR